MAADPVTDFAGANPNFKADVGFLSHLLQDPAKHDCRLWDFSAIFSNACCQRTEHTAVLLLHADTFGKQELDTLKLASHDSHLESSFDDLGC